MYPHRLLGASVSYTDILSRYIGQALGPNPQKKIIISTIEGGQKRVPRMGPNQISANRGSDSRFELESNLKTLSPRSSRSSIMNVMNRDQSKQEFKPGSKSIDYFGSYTNIDSHKDHFTLLYCKSQILLESSY